MADINEDLFTLTIEVRTHIVGEVPGGNKIDLEYVPQGSKVTAFGAHFKARVRAGLEAEVRENLNVELKKTAKDDAELRSQVEGELDKQFEARLESCKLISGQDWVTINDDGVADFSGRLTLKFGRALVGAHLSGRADLILAKNAAGSKVTPEAETDAMKDEVAILGPRAYQLWKTGFGDDVTLAVAMAITFEVGEDDAANIPALDRALYLGIGTVTFTKTTDDPSHIQKIVLDVRKICLT